MKIIVADDCHDTVHTMTVLIQLLGHEVYGACDGQEAVSLASRLRPDAAILDLTMPRLDGFQAAAQIRELLPDTVLVAHTGWHKKPVPDNEGEKPLFDHYATKPVDLAELLATMAETHRSRMDGGRRAAYVDGSEPPSPRR